MPGLGGALRPSLGCWWFISGWLIINHHPQNECYCYISIENMGSIHLPCTNTTHKLKIARRWYILAVLEHEVVTTGMRKFAVTAAFLYSWFLYTHIQMPLQSVLSERLFDTLFPHVLFLKEMLDIHVMFIILLDAQIKFFRMQRWLSSYHKPRREGGRTTHMHTSGSIAY